MITPFETLKLIRERFPCRDDDPQSPIPLPEWDTLTALFDRFLATRSPIVFDELYCYTFALLDSYGESN